MKQTDRLGEIRDKTIVLTGASSGMGLEFSRQLAAMGFKIAMVSNREEELEREAEAIRENCHATVLTRCADLSSPGAAEDLLAWCDASGFSPNYLINNAGMFFMEYLGSDSLNKVRTMMNLHMDVVTELCVLFGGRMKSKRFGRRRRRRFWKRRSKRRR